MWVTIHTTLAREWEKHHWATIWTAFDAQFLFTRYRKECDGLTGMLVSHVRRRLSNSRECLILVLNIYPILYGSDLNAHRNKLLMRMLQEWKSWLIRPPFMSLDLSIKWYLLQLPVQLCMLPYEHSSYVQYCMCISLNMFFAYQPYVPVIWCILCDHVYMCIILNVCIIYPIFYQ